MATHIKVVGILHIVFGCLGLLGGLAVLMFFGGLASVLGATAQTDDALRAVPVLGGIGGIIFFLVAILSLPSLIIGIGLLQFRPWARVPGIILSAFDLLNIPFGTALGVYGLWALLSREGEALFRRPDLLPAARY